MRRIKSAASCSKLAFAREEKRGKMNQIDNTKHDFGQEEVAISGIHAVIESLANTYEVQA